MGDALGQVLLADRGKEEGHVARGGETGELAAHKRLAGGVQPGERGVKKQDARTAEQGPCEKGAARLAVGKLRDMATEQRLQAERPEQRGAAAIERRTLARERGARAY